MDDRTEHRWKVVDVESLPSPHDLFKCRWRDKFRQIAAGAEDQVDLRVVFDKFIASGLDLNQCPYHAADWKSAAAVACGLVETGRTGDPDDIDAAIARAVPDGDVREAVWSFFAEPIFITGDRLGNGPHRLCAMSARGVKRCPIDL